MPPMLPPPRDGDPFVPMPPPQRPSVVLAPEPVSRWKRPVERSSLLWALAIVATAWCTGLLGVYVGARVTQRTTSVYQSSQPVTVGTPRDASLDARLDVGAVTAVLRPSVVSVSTDISDSGVAGEGVATGVILTTDGAILTNAHVVEGATEVRVRLAGEREPHLATVLATDPENDLALLQIDVTALVPARLADPSSVRVGDEVIAIGYALDLDGEASVTLGIVSALDRTILTAHGALDGLIQTDAAISSGNSGGPLVNANNEVVGINTAVAQGDVKNTANNIGFAISIEQVLPELDVLRAKAAGQDRRPGFLGVRLSDRVDGGTGAPVAEITTGSPAENIGIKTGDLIISIDGRTIEGSAGVIGAIRDDRPGDKVKVVVDRNGEEITFDVTLTNRPAGTG